jgi:hypothetical protein
MDPNHGCEIPYCLQWKYIIDDDTIIMSPTSANQIDFLF